MAKKSCAVVIFNFVDFDKHKLERRTSSLLDVERIEKLFYLFDTSIEKVMNPSLEELNEAVTRLSNEDYSDYESILLIYMSHGDTDNTIYCKDGKFNFLEESKKICRNSTLNNKPKFIIVQACKGSFDTNTMFDTDDQQQNVGDDSRITAILMSSFEGFVSRLGPEGSKFIECFTDTVRRSWNKKPFIQVLMESHENFNRVQYESAGTIIPYVRPDENSTISNFTFH